MKDTAIKDWFLFGEWFDIYWFHSCWLDGLAHTLKEVLGDGLSQIVAEQDQSVERIYFSRSEWTRLGQRYLDEVVSAPQRLFSVLRDIRMAADELIKFSQNLTDLDLASLSAGEEVKILEQYHERHHRLWSLGMVPNVLELENYFLTDYLKAWLKERGLSDQQLVEQFQILVTIRELSGLQQQERAMLTLAVEGALDRQIQEHAMKYNWIHFGWTGPALTVDYFREVYEGLRKSGEAMAQRKKILSGDRKLVADKVAMIKELDMPNDIQRLFRGLEEILFMKTYRMDALFMSYAATQPLLQKIAQEHFVSLKQVYILYLPWLIDQLKQGRLDADYINQLGRHSVRYFDGEAIRLLVGEEAEKFIAPIWSSLPRTEAANELKGECAYPGQAQGIVRVVNLASEMSKFNEGDILISNVTDPSLLPIMKKAAAFVTNQGGLTCHAAIVARELHIPCLIGTKVATHVFKDGDLVEVDAAKGVVRKL